MTQAVYNVARLRAAEVNLGEKRFGADRTGSADSRAALLAAITAADEGRAIRVPEGIYKIACPAGAAGLPITGLVRLQGAGRSNSRIQLHVTDTVAAVRYLFSIASTGRLQIDGVQLEIVNSGTDQCGMFAGDGLTGLRLWDTRMLGGVTDNGAAAAYTCYGMVFSNSSGVTQEDIVLQSCYAERMHWFFQKSNTAESTQRHIRVRDSEFSTFYRTPLQFNSPLGVMDDVALENNTVRDNRGHAIGTANCFHVAAMGTAIRVVGTQMSGAVDYAMHFEELPDKVSVLGNIADIPGGSNGFIRLVNNNNSGVMVGPNRVEIIGNLAVYSGTPKASGTRGILVNNDGNVATADATNVDIRSNYMEAFQYGLALQGNLADGITPDSNTAVGCEVGFRATGSQFRWHGNTSKQCDAGVSAVNGGSFVDHRFSDCTTAATDGRRWVELVNPRWEFAPFDVGAGSTTWKDMQALTSGSRVDAKFAAYAVSSTTADIAHRTTALTWDGSSLGSTAGVANAAGGFALTTEDNSGTLAAKLVSTSARTNVRLSVQAVGTISVAA